MASSGARARFGFFRSGGTSDGGGGTCCGRVRLVDGRPNPDIVSAIAKTTELIATSFGGDISNISIEESGVVEHCDVELGGV